MTSPWFPWLRFVAGAATTLNPPTATMNLQQLGRRRWQLPNHWAEFFSCVLMHVTAPFVPLGLEKWLTHSVETKSWCLFVAMYSMSIGISSGSILMYSFTLLIGFVFSCLYGWLSAQPHSLPPYLDETAIAALALVIISHVIERFRRHVLDRAPFWEFRSASVAGGGSAAASQQ
jgi:hypothetical protein